MAAANSCVWFSEFSRSLMYERQTLGYLKQLSRRPIMERSPYQHIAPKATYGCSTECRSFACLAAVLQGKKPRLGTCVYLYPAASVAGSKAKRKHGLRTPRRVRSLCRAM